jgi:site-specific DNA-methyltransferase (adenine-specific)
MEIKDLKITDLKPYEKNPRMNDNAVPYVANSIKEFGFKVPIIIDKKNVIVAGHTRYKAAQQLGLETVPCIIADDLTPKQIKAFRLADNKTAEKAEWETEFLSDELKELLDVDMGAFGFEDVLDDLEEELEAQEDDYEMELPEDPMAKTGQIWQLGKHRLMCGDSTKKADVLQLVGGCKMDILITDPPYNVSYEGKTKDNLKIQNDNLNSEDFRTFLRDAFKNADDVMREGAAFYIWYASSETINFESACNDAGWKIRQNLIWEKNTFVLGRQDYQWNHEPCLYGWKDGAAHTWMSDRKQTTILKFNRPIRNDIHPTMKPIPLFDYQIKNNTRSGDKVLDLFGGSGTTIMACEQNGRTAYVMEYDPKYADAIIDRWQTYTGEKAVLLESEG